VGAGLLGDTQAPVSTERAVPERGLSRAIRWWLHGWPAVVPAVVLSVVYGCTLQRSTGNAFSPDTTKFDYLGLVLGTAHPPGYPLYTMLNAAFIRAVPFGSVALRANLLSAVFAVLACVVAVRVLRELGVPPVLAAGGATALGLLPALWRHAVVAEIYSLTTLLVLVVLGCVLIFERTGRKGWLRAGVLVFGFSFAHATSNVLLIPGLLLYLAVRRPRWLLRPRELLTLFPAAALLALVPYAYLAWRTAVGGTTWLETRVSDLPSLWAAITGARFGDQMFAVPLAKIQSDRLPELWTAALGELGPLLAVSAMGLVVLAWKRPLILAVTAGWAICTAVFALGYKVGDWQSFLLLTWLMLALWSVVGLARCIAAAGAWAPAVAVVVAVALPVTALITGYSDADRSDPDPQRDVDEAIASVPDDSLIFTRDYETRHQFTYRLLPDGLGARRNVWAAKGAIYTPVPDRMVYQLRQYCAPSTGPWLWPSQEQPLAPSVPRGLKTFIYGHSYAKRVRHRGFTVDHVKGQLYSFECPRAAS
jgi:hypothetical protein